MSKLPVKKIILLWVVWFTCVYAFQFVVSTRYTPAYPDNVIFWTEYGTTPEIVQHRKFLTESFLKNQSAWDSEFYVEIALFGYHNPDTRTEYSEKYKETVYDVKAFFPVYPMVMRAVSMPFRLFGMEAVAAVKLAGVIVSLLGTLAAMFALFFIIRKKAADSDAFKALFFMLIFPTGFFFAQIYTEGLFAGLAFWAIALAMDRKFLPASVLAAIAVWTKGVGVLLFIPIAWEWLQSLELEWKRLSIKRIPWKKLPTGLLLLLPIASFAAFSLSPIGKDFYHTQKIFFGRTNFSVNNLTEMLGYLGYLIKTGAAKSLVYYAIEYSLVLLALVSCFMLIRRYTAAALFGLAVIAVSFLSGPFQSQSRYILTAPTLFIMLGGFGKNETFDRGWTIASLLLMGMLATLFTFKMWVA